MTYQLGNAKVWDGTAWVAAVLPLPTVTVTGEDSDVVTNIGGVDYRVVTWLSSGSLTVADSQLDGVDFLLVGGGGGGGNSNPGDGAGAGGGGGGLYEVSLASFYVGTTTITVGAGGVGSSDRLIRGGNGTQSKINDTYVLGGGGGGSASASRGNAGAAGGGGVRFDHTFGQGIAGFGANGGANTISPFPGGGGGGGGASGTVGGNGSASGGGNGGNGTSSSINGTATTYGGGGGGSARLTASTPGTGGTGGGGGGGTDLSGGNGVNGTDGLGGGGGGSGAASLGTVGGNGGDGIVIVRWPTANEA